MSIRFSSLTALVACSLLTFGFAENTNAQPHDAQAFDLPRDASQAWPDGEYGVDFNVGDENGLRHGSWIRVYEDGSLYYVGHYNHGTPDGSWWFFHQDGHAISHVIHNDDPAESRAVIYHPNGRIAGQGSYVHPSVKMSVDGSGEETPPPLRDGVWTWYDAQGHLNSTTTYDRGNKHGAFVRYLPDGTQSEAGQYVQSKPDGKWQSWHDNGNLRHVIHHIQGELEGPFQAFYESGVRLSEGQYLEGKEHGVWKFYLKDGRLGHLYGYQSGNQVNATYVNGTYTDWYDEERPKYERSYENKLLEGPFREWHDQGEFVLETHVDEDTGTPIQRRVMVGVELSREGEYVQGKLDGPVYHYDTSGLLIKTEHFDMGTLVQTETH